jgi:hypothetical protein
MSRLARAAHGLLRELDIDEGVSTPLGHRVTELREALRDEPMFDRPITGEGTVSMERELRDPRDLQVPALVIAILGAVCGVTAILLAVLL